MLCSLFTRVGPGGNSLGELPGWVSGDPSNALTSAGQNFASRERTGIDINASYRTRFFRNWILDTNLIYVHTIKQSDFQNPAFPNFENRLLEELGNPRDEFRLDTDVRIGKLTVGHRLHYIGPMYVNLFEDFNPLPGGLPGGPRPEYLSAERRRLGRRPAVPAVFYNDIRLQWDTGPMGMIKNVQIYGGIDNIFDRHPPFGSTATGAGPGGERQYGDLRYPRPQLLCGYQGALLRRRTIDIALWSREETPGSFLLRSGKRSDALPRKVCDHSFRPGRRPAPARRRDGRRRAAAAGGAGRRCPRRPASSRCGT